MSRLVSGVDDNFSPNDWRQVTTKESARPDDLPQVHFDYDERDVMSLNLELSNRRALDIVHKLHDLGKETRLLTLGEAFACVQAHRLHTSLDSDEEQYRVSLAWQTNQELKRLSSSFHKPWTTQQMTEFCHLMLGVLIGASCLKNVDDGRLDKVFTIEEKVWIEFDTNGRDKVRNLFFDGVRVNPHGLNFTRQQIEPRLDGLGMDEQTLSYVLAICGQLELTTNQLVQNFKLGTCSSAKGTRKTEEM